MNKDKEWEVEATIEIRTSFFCDTKEEAEKEAHKYLSELCQGERSEGMIQLSLIRLIIVCLLCVVIGISIATFILTK